MKMTKEFRDEIVTVLYEKCSAGEITVDEREELIQEANNELIDGVDLPYDDEVSEEVHVEEACAKEAAEEEKPADSEEEPEKEPEEPKEKEEAPKDKEKSSKKLTKKEKYEIFKDAVYKKCKDGEITEEFREQLLEKARETFLPDSE